MGGAEKKPRAPAYRKKNPVEWKIGKMEVYNRVSGYRYVKVIDTALEHGIKLKRHMHSPAGETRADCPFCGDKSGHLYLNSEKNTFHCFRCGTSGGAVKFKALLSGTSEAEVIRECAKYAKGKAVRKDTVHPALKLTETQLKQIGFLKKPDWVKLKQENPERFLNIRSWVWKEWNDYKKTIAAETAFWFEIVALSCGTKEAAKFLVEMEHKTEIPGLFKAVVKKVKEINERSKSHEKNHRSQSPLQRRAAPDSVKRERSACFM